MAGRSGKTPTPRPSSKPNRTTAAPPTGAPDDAQDLGERVRRLALGLTTALVVARAYWPAEYLTELETGQQLPWVFAILATTALAVVGAMISRTLRVRFSWADVAILGLIAAVGMAATHAADRRVAINLAWQWGGVGLLYALFRNLPRTREESRALAGVLAATAVAVSVYAVFQVAVELPELRDRFRQNPTRVMAMLGMSAPPGSPEFQQFADRLVNSTEAFATFGLANSLAGYIVGPLVLGIGVWLVGLGRRLRPSTQAPGEWPAGPHLLSAALPLLLMVVVLQLTKSRSAVLGLGVGGVILLASMASRLGRRLVIGGGLGLLGVGVAVAAGLWKVGLLDREVLTQSSLSLRYRLEYWEGTWRLLRDGATWWSGLGPGNFRAAYRQHKLVASSEDLADPHNLFLEVWAIAGIVAMVLLILGLALVLTNLFGKSKPLVDGEASAGPVGPAPPRPVSLLLWGWLGGWLGVLLLGDLNLFTDDNSSLYRWLLLGGGWGAAALLSAPLWRRVDLPPVALGAGIVAMVVNLLAAGGIGYASVASMLWGLSAIGLNLREDRACGRLRNLSGLFPPFVAASALAALIGTFYGTVSPYWRAQAAMNQADRILADRPSAPREEDLDRVGTLLDRAIAADSYATRPYLALAELELLAWLARGAPLEDAVWNRVESLFEAARTPPRDPRSLEVRRARIHAAERILAARPDLPRLVRDRLRRIIADAWYTIATELSPTRPIERAQAAEALAAVQEFERAVRQAEIALELDDQIIHHQDKKLSPASREHLMKMIPEWKRQAEENLEESSDE